MAARASHLSVRRKLFLSYMLLFTIPLLTMLVLMYVVLVRNIETNEKKTYMNILANVSQSMDAKMDELTKFGWQLSNTTWVKTVAYMQGSTIDYDRIDAVMLKEYQQQFINYKAINNFADEIALYFQSKDLVISSLGEQPMDRFAATIFDTRDLDLQALVKSDRTLYFSRMDISTYGQQRKGYLYMLRVPIYGLKDNVMALFFIPERSLQTVMNPLLIAQSAQASLQDKAGHLIYRTPAESAGLHEERLGFSSRSFQSGWLYAIDIPKRALMSEIATVRLGILLLVLLSGIVGWSLSFRLAKRGYKPLASLISLMQQKSGGPSLGNKTNEYDWLQHQLQAVFEQEAIVTERLREQQPFIKDAYLKRLVDGRFEPGPELFRALELLDLKFRGPLYGCCLLQGIKPGAPAVDRLIRNGASLHMGLYPVEQDDRTILLCDYADRRTFLDFCLREAAAIRDEGASDFVLAAGMDGGDLFAFSGSYRQALEAMECRGFQRNDEPLILFEEAMRSGGSFYYPADVELRMMNVLKSGQHESAAALFEEVWTRNAADSAVSPLAFRNLLLNMELTLLRIIEQAGLGDRLHVEPRSVLNGKRLEDAKAFFLEAYRELCSLLPAGQGLKNQDINQRIVAFVDRHYTDPAMSLSMVAERHHLSPSYLSRIFKEITGQNFLDYVSRKRMARAKELLLDGRTEIKDISRLVGYDSDVTFRRMFKKFEGVTPSQFRVIR